MLSSWLGFAPDGVLTAKLILRGERYEDPASAAAFHAALVERAEGTPGLRAATVDFLPLNHETSGSWFAAPAARRRQRHWCEIPCAPSIPRCP